LRSAPSGCSCGIEAWSGFSHICLAGLQSSGSLPGSRLATGKTLHRARALEASTCLVPSAGFGEFTSAVWAVPVDFGRKQKPPAGTEGFLLHRLNQLIQVFHQTNDESGVNQELFQLKESLCHKHPSFPQTRGSFSLYACGVRKGLAPPV
jgi:hypothetical protein